MECRLPLLEDVFVSLAIVVAGLEVHNGNLGGNLEVAHSRAVDAVGDVGKPIPYVVERVTCFLEGGEAVWDIRTEAGLGVPGTWLKKH